MLDCNDPKPELLRNLKQLAANCRVIVCLNKADVWVDRILNQTENTGLITSAISQCRIYSLRERNESQLCFPRELARQLQFVFSATLEDDSFAMAFMEWQKRHHTSSSLKWVAKCF